MHAKSAFARSDGLTHACQHEAIGLPPSTHFAAQAASSAHIALVPHAVSSLQHDAASQLVHVLAPGGQIGLAQSPSAHEVEQHSAATVHDAPTGAHGGGPHTGMSSVWHIFEQQAAASLHGA